MQSYSLASLSLILASTVTAGYAWQAPSDETPRVAILANSKPAKAEIAALFAETAPAVEELTTSVEADSAGIQPIADPLNLALAGLAVEPAALLPTEYDQFEPSTVLKEETDIGPLAFSTEISTDYQAVDPQRIFAEGQYTLYATFAYESMVNGMAWSWVWRHNGAVIDGGNELWNYGGNGPGYIYLNPEEGFKNGEYALEVWVNGERFAQSSVIMNNAAVAAGN